MAVFLLGFSLHFANDVDTIEKAVSAHMDFFKGTDTDGMGQLAQKHI